MTEARALGSRSDQRYETLQRSGLFSILDEPELYYAAEHSVIRRFARGQTVVHRGGASTGMHAIIDGYAKLSIESAEGGEVIFAMLGGGDWFGEVALMDGGLEPVSAIATRPLTVMTVNRTVILELVERNSRLSMAFAGLLATRARAQNRRIEEIHLYDLSTRLARTLMGLTRHHVQREGGALRVMLPLTQTELAAMLGATRVRVNLLLGAYRDAGIIRMDGSSILILSPERLSERARIS